MKPFKLLGILGLLCVISYVGYVLLQANKVPKTIQIGSADSFKSIPATVCTLGNDTNTLSGMLYVFHDAARFDITSIVNGTAISVHVVDTRDDDAYYWVDGQKDGAKGDYGPVYNIVGLQAITRINCSPWWLPNGASYIVPQDVSFARSV